LAAANNATSTLNGGIADDAVALTLTSSASFSSTAPFRITIDSEVLEVGAINQSTHVLSSLLRGQEGTAAAAHLTAAVVTNRWTKGTYEELVGTNRTVSTTAPLAGGGALSANLTLTHADTAGYKHIPTAGEAEQWLKYSASGTAAWTTLLGETSTTAYRGDRGVTAYDHSQAATGAEHGAVSAATVSMIMRRDAAGRAKVVAPSAEDDIALKSNVTTVQTNLDAKMHATTGHAHTGAAGDAPSLLGETETTAYRGDRGTTAYDYSQVGHLPLAGGNIAGTVNFQDNIAQRPELKDYAETSVAANSSTAYTVDLTTGNVFEITLTGDCVFTFSNPPASGKAGSFTLILAQDGTGSRTTTWPASVKWAGGTAPTLSTAASSVDLLAFTTRDAGTTWYGALVGLAFAVPA
jgi:hypothetical protein